MLAGLCKAPGIAIDEDEADQLAKSFERVIRWYDIPEIGEKAMDHYAFAATLGTVYGTRFFAWLNTGLDISDTPAQPAAAPQARAEQPRDQPRGDGSITVVDPTLGALSVPPLAGAQPHSERRQ